jgi:hypothetical protein
MRLILSLENRCGRSRLPRMATCNSVALAGQPSRKKVQSTMSRTRWWMIQTVSRHTRKYRTASGRRLCHMFKADTVSSHLPRPDIRRVISLSFDGQLNWISAPLEGAAAGSPVVSFDGRYVFLTHNSNVLSVGHFSVLDTFGASTNASILPIYSEFNDTYPFSPPGIYHNPAEGYYDGGQGNTNDLVIWSFAPKPLESQVGVGAAFVFQFPIGYVAPNEADARQADQDGDDQDDFARRLFWIMLGDDVKDWQAISAPVLTNMGRSLYWSVSRSQFRGWIGSSSSGVARFNRGRTGGPTFGRGSPRYAACPNTPALSSSTTEPMIFAGTAANEFVKMDYLMKNDTYILRNTASKVSAKAIVSPDDLYVYFTEFTGVLHQASTEDLVDNWNLTNIGVQDGEFAMTSDGSMIIVGDVTGNVQAFQVAPLPAKAPTFAPASEQPSTLSQATSPAGFRPTVPAPTFGFPQPLSSPTSKPTFAPIFNTIPTTTDDPDVTSGGVQTTLQILWIALVAILALMV